jgi:hypothetical protein
MNEPTKKTNLEELLRKSFLVNGKVQKIASIKFVIKNKNVEGNVFELTDSKRGEFYVIIAK